MTNLIEIPEPPTLGDQRPAIGALAALVTMCGNLPPASISFHRHESHHLYVQVDGPQDFEQWREALRITPALVEWKTYDHSVWMAAEGEFLGAHVVVRGFGVPVAFEVALVSPAEDAERFRAGLLAEQHHQLDDDAEPDPGAYIGLPAAWVAAVSA